MITERDIVTGLIVSTDYLKAIRSMWDINLIESVSAKRIALWCWEYFEKYNKAPQKQIEGIFFSKMKESKLSREVAQDMEEILNSLSEEFDEDTFNVEYLFDETRKYFTLRRLELHTMTIKAQISEGKMDLAEQTACNYKPAVSGSENDIDIGSEEVLNRLELAFKTTEKSIIEYRGAIGEFWNGQLVKGGLVALLAPEKRGKTFLMIDLAIRAANQNRKVAFFQAGDLSESNFLKRISVYLAQRSDREKYCKEHFQPVRDCIRNQLNSCINEDRTCNFGVFEDRTEKEVREDIQMMDVIEAYNSNPNYHPCTSCDEYREYRKRLGVVWMKKMEAVKPLTLREAKSQVEKFFINKKRQFKLSTYANNTLTINQIRAKLDIWEKEDGFVPDLIVIDYADLIVPETRTEFRHQQNEIWKGLRRLSQEKGHPLVITATQSDADSYEKGRLRLSNFSEDKRKYGHATAFYGLNQDPKGREKRFGIMRINELLLREDEFDVAREVTILQNLKKGRPFLGSYW
jgi:hypothetical protein